MCVCVCGGGGGEEEDRMKTTIYNPLSLDYKGWKAGIQAQDEEKKGDDKPIDEVGMVHCFSN